MTVSRKVGRVNHVGFTLIEVLVVVAIIALLISILLPSLNAAREQAKRTVCATSLKQIMAATHMYAISYAGVLPNSGPQLNACQSEEAFHKYIAGSVPVEMDSNPDAGLRQTAYWVHDGLLFSTRQIKQPELFYCPSSKDRVLDPTLWRTRDVTAISVGAIKTGYLYALNGQIDMLGQTVGYGAAPTGDGVSYRPYKAKLEKVKITDAMYADDFVSDGPTTTFNWPHKGGVNGGYIDGSAQLTSVPDKVVGLANFVASQDPSGNAKQLYRDYFSFCFFRMLSSQKIWMNSNSFAPNYAVQLPPASAIPANPYP